jgi:hypothetical protein
MSAGRAYARRAPSCVGILAAALLAVRCASPGVPPGGPPDEDPPALIGMSPESASTNVKARDVELEFDEVVSEVPQGARAAGGVPAAGGGSFTGVSAGPSLASIVLLSPRAGALSVDWHRSRITIHPQHPLRPNTTYTLTVLPGLADLRNNVRDSAIVSVFSTGDRIATGRLGGVVFDWPTGKPAASAVVEAIAPDSTTYVAIADSVGRFTLRNLPPDQYVIRGVVDANNNRAFDPREAFDTVRVTAGKFNAGDSAHIELLAFVHDTVGTRITSVTVRDSVTLRLAFDRPLDPTQRITPDRFRLISRDSAVVPIREAYTGVDYDSAQARKQRAAADSAARASGDTARRDTTRRVRAVDSLAAIAARRDTTRGRKPPAPPPVPSRPSPATEVVLVLGEPLRPNTFYRVSVRDQRSVSGTTVKSSERAFSTPKPQPAADTTRRAPGDTTRRPPRPVPNDTTRRVPTRPDGAPRRPR